MEISNKESTEKQIWEKFKENLGNCKDPAKAIEIAKKTISDALEKRGKDTKSNTGIAKIYQAVEQCRDPQDQLKILATGRDLNNNKLTGYGTKWKNEIKNKFQKLLENESKKNPPTNNSSNSSSPLYNKLVSFFDCKGAVTDENTLNAQIELIKNSKSKEQIKDAINKNQIAFFNVNIKERTKDLINDSDKFKAFLKVIDEQLTLIQNKPIKYLENIDKQISSYFVYNKYMNEYATIFSNAFGVTKDDFLKNILNKSNIYFKNLLVVSYCNKKAT